MLYFHHKNQLILKRKKKKRFRLTGAGCGSVKKLNTSTSEKTRNKTCLLLKIISNTRGFLESTKVLEFTRKKGSGIH